MLEAALVDVGGTLWPDRLIPDAEPVLLERLAGIGLVAADGERLLAEIDLRNPAGQDPLPLRQDTVARTAEALNAAGIQGIGPRAVMDAMDFPVDGLVKPFDGVETLLQTLKASGLRVVIFSNATFRGASGYRRDFGALGWAPWIDAIVSSVDVGWRKPSDEFFNAALDAAETQEKGCLVIGDSEEKDIVPSARRGARTLRVDVEMEGPGGSAAEAVVTSLDKAAEVASGWV
jgi:FMN phosphatase YigB (HAD superfamily)